MKINWASKGIILALAALAVFLGQQKFRQYRLQTAIESEKQSLQKQLSGLEGKNEELNRTLSYLNSDTYKELVARQQLDMQRQGEFVYSFSEAARSEPSVLGAKDEASNFQKWANYFLNKKQEE